MTKATIILILCFTAGAMAAHTYRQQLIAYVYLVEEGIAAYRQSAVVGYWRMDRVTKQLYYDGNP